MKQNRILSSFLALALMLPLLLCGSAARAAEWTDTGLLWLVNNDHRIPADYTPVDLQGEGGGLRPEAFAAYQAMLTDLKAAGYSVTLSSGYRSYDTQTYLFDTRLAERRRGGMSYTKAYEDTRLYTAVPGASEHQLGLAADLKTGSKISATFANTGAGKWIFAHCAQYGFIRRYAGEKTALTQVADEAWHFRYVGVPHAEIMVGNNWCLEEYITYLRENGKIQRNADGDMIYEVLWSANAPAYRADAIDCSGDNMGGYITTVYRSSDPLAPARGHWAEPYLQTLFSRGGLPDLGPVDPDAPISRGAFAALYAQLSLPQTGEPVTFPDVPLESLYRAAVDTLGRAGVLSSGGAFFPDQYLTRSEAAVFTAGCLMIRRLRGWTTPTRRVFPAGRSSLCSR